MTAHHRRSVTRHSRSLLRRLGAIVQLLAVLGVPPALLLALVGSPLDPPAPLRTVGALTTVVDDRSLLWLVAVAAWLLFAHLLASLFVEALRQTRGSNLRLPLPGLMFGANAALASHLIASLVLTAHVGGGNSGPTMASLTPAVVRAAASTPTAAEQTSMVAGPWQLAPVEAPPAVGVHPDVAADGPRHVPTAGDTAPGRALMQCRVLPPDGRDHDTLWDIAERHLGDGTRWREVYDLNQGRLMPDGQRLTRASLIHPGWILTLPADAVALDRDRVGAPVRPAVDDVHAGVPAPVERAPQQPAGHRPHQAVPDPADRPVRHVPGAEPAAVTAPTTPRVANNGLHLGQPAGPSTPQSDNDTDPDADNGQSVPIQVTGVLGIAALGLLAALTRRRKVAGRRRPPGARTALPAPDLLEEEQRIRHEARLAHDTCAAVRLALLLAAKTAPGVQLKAVWQHADGSLELVWTDQSSATRRGHAAPAPFENSARGWLLPQGAHRLLFALRADSAQRPEGVARLDAELAGRSDAFPLLLPVGSRDGSACLVNLELFGLISLTTEPVRPDTISTASTALVPSPPRPVELVGAWVQALAGAPWAEPVRIRVPEQLADLAVGLEHVSVAERAGYDGGLPADLVEQVRLAGSFSAARRASDGVDESISEVLVGYPLTLVQPAALTAATDPAQPLVLLLLESHPDASIWMLCQDGRLSIPGVADDLTPLRLDPDRHQRLLRLLEHAQDPPQVSPDNPHRQLLRAQCPPLPDAEPAAGPANHSSEVIDLSDSAPPPPPTTPELPAVPAVTDVPAPAAPVGAAAKATRGTDPDPDFAGPMEIGVLGPVTVTGPDRAQPRETSMQMLLYMAFHRRPLSGQQLWEALWPNDPYQATTSRTRRSELKQYIKPLLTVSQGPRYRVDDLVKTDWQRFQSLADGNPAQQLAALALIRGVPFQHAQLDWVHLEGHFAEIEASTIDLALDVAGRAMRQRDYDTARTAAMAGLRGAPYEERLYRIAMQSAAARGATAELQHLRRQLAIVIEDELEPDDALEPATSQLLAELDGKAHRRAALGRHLDSS
jgi:DNA-binding SARP family transcriptional activator